MPRKPSAEPSLHKASGWWVMYVKRKMVYLSKDREAARVMMRERLFSQVGGSPAPRKHIPFAQMSFYDLCQEYLTDLKARRPGGALSQFERLQRADKILGSVLVSEMKRFHLARIEQAMKQARKSRKGVLEPLYSPTTINDTLSAVQAVFGWAVRCDLLDHNPLIGYRKPTRKGRTRLVTQAEFRSLLRWSHPAFRLFLFVMRETGCRPCELRTLRWVQVDFGRALFSVVEHKTRSTQKDPRPRIVALSPGCLLRLNRMSLQATRKFPQDGQSNNPNSSFVFLNSKGQPWTKNALVQAMDDARKKAGIEPKQGEQISLYSLRHNFGTLATKRLGIYAASKLLGHTSTKVTENYAHSNVDDLIEWRQRLSDPIPDAQPKPDSRPLPRSEEPKRA